MTYKTQPEALRLAAQLEDADGARLHLLPYAAAELRRLHAEVESLRTDAERYRWLRKGESDDVAVVRGLGAMDYGMSAVVSTYSEEIDGDDLDAAIDAAMHAGKPIQRSPRPPRCWAEARPRCERWSSQAYYASTTWARSRWRR